FLFVGSIFLIDVAEDNDADGDEVPWMLPTGAAAAAGVPFVVGMVTGFSRVDECRQAKGMPTQAELDAHEAQRRRDREAEIARRVDACEAAGPAGSIDRVTLQSPQISPIQACGPDGAVVGRDQPIAHGRVFA